jgi:hypothetical protein
MIPIRLPSIALFAAVLSGCVVSPAEIKEQGPRAEFKSQQPPATAAACVARNTENSGNAFIGQVNTSVREGSAPRHVELVVFSGTNFFVNANFAPEGSGSLVTVWTSPHLVDFAKERFLGAFRGC